MPAYYRGMPAAGIRIAHDARNGNVWGDCGLSSGRSQLAAEQLETVTGVNARPLAVSMA